MTAATATVTGVVVEMEVGTIVSVGTRGETTVAAAAEGVTTIAAAATTGTGVTTATGTGGRGHGARTASTGGTGSER